MESKNGSIKIINMTHESIYEKGISSLFEEKYEMLNAQKSNLLLLEDKKKVVLLDLISF